jgi:hypothetical protein
MNADDWRSTGFSVTDFREFGCRAFHCGQDVRILPADGSDMFWIQNDHLYGDQFDRARSIPWDDGGVRTTVHAWDHRQKKSAAKAAADHIAGAHAEAHAARARLSIVENSWLPSRK